MSPKWRCHIFRRFQAHGCRSQRPLAQAMSCPDRGATVFSKGHTLLMAWGLPGEPRSSVVDIRTAACAFRPTPGCAEYTDFLSGLKCCLRALAHATCGTAFGAGRVWLSGLFWGLLRCPRSPIGLVQAGLPRSAPLGPGSSALRPPKLHPILPTSRPIQEKPRCGDAQTVETTAAPRARHPRRPDQFDPGRPLMNTDEIAHDCFGWEGRGGQQWRTSSFYEF